MMPPTHLFLALCAAALLAAAPQIQAQASNPEPAPAPEPAVRPRQSSHVSQEQATQWFNLLDANHDGCISREEARVAILIAPKLARDFDEADSKHEGCITPDEIRALAERRRVEREARRAAQAQQKAATQAASPNALVSPTP